MTLSSFSSPARTASSSGAGLLGAGESAGFTLPQDRPDTGVDLGRTDNFAWNFQPGGPGSYQPALATAWHGSLLNLDIFVGGSLPEYRPGNDRWAEELYARYRDRFIETMPTW